MERAYRTYRRAFYSADEVLYCQALARIPRVFNQCRDERYFLPVVLAVACKAQAITLVLCVILAIFTFAADKVFEKGITGLFNLF